MFDSLETLASVVVSGTPGQAPKLLDTLIQCQHLSKADVRNWLHCKPPHEDRSNIMKIIGAALTMILFSTRTYSVSLIYSSYAPLLLILILLDINNFQDHFSLHNSPYLVELSLSSNPWNGKNEYVTQFQLVERLPLSLSEKNCKTHCRGEELLPLSKWLL